MTIAYEPSKGKGHVNVKQLTDQQGRLLKPANNAAAAYMDRVHGGDRKRTPAPKKKPAGPTDAFKAAYEGLAA